MGNPNRSYHQVVERLIRIGLAQVNTTVGDLEGNTHLITEWIGRARDEGADIVAFPELALTGYPPEDLVLKPGFVRETSSSSTSSRDRPRESRRSSVSSTRTETFTTPPLSCTTARSKRSTTRSFCRTMGCSTSSAISHLATGLRSSSSQEFGSASPSARTAGIRQVRWRGRRTTAPSS